MHKKSAMCTSSQDTVRLLMGTVFPRSTANVCGNAAWERGMMHSKIKPLLALVLGGFSAVSKGASVEIDKNISN